jgi:hypothetical protein
VWIAELWISWLLAIQFGWWAFLRSPRASYEKGRYYRDKILDTVALAQQESAKWRALFTTLRLPYTFLTKGLGVSPNMAISMLVAGSAVGGGVVAAEVMEGRSFSAGHSGTYLAPGDEPVEWEEGTQTLRVDLGTTPLGRLELSNISINTHANSALPSGQTNALILGGVAASSDPVFVETYLEVGELYIEKWRCSKLTMEHIEVNHLILTKNAADGISHNPVAGTPRARGISGGVRANEMSVKNSTYDQVVITSATTNIDGRVDVIRMTNIWSKEPCLLSRIKAGTITITLSEVGNGDGLALKDWTIANTVVYQTLEADQNIEILISPPS